ncbi:MAG TPA: PQQ-binding-like beta-propeller repeat protein [Ktedonobacterales bacterium]|nr:PQQ-binding-like beta-propeller repeat protein [Ktedonobacterales bacterium]
MKRTQWTHFTTSTTGRTGLKVVVLLLTASVLLAACGTSKPAAAPLASGSWPNPNGDLANTRDAADSTISSANVSKLAQAWTFTLPGTAPCAPLCGVQAYGFIAAAPIVLNGVVYIQDLDSNVYALALTSGKLKWEYKVNAPEQSGPGPNGVAVVDGAVYGASPTSAFALNATTGRTIWVNSHLLGKGQGTFGIQPQVASGRVYLASQYGSGSGGGILLALNASTGEVLWTFNTVLSPDPGVQAIGTGTGGAWETPLVSSDGSVTYGIGNPYQSAASAIAYPSAQLYTDSAVNLDAATGKLRWYYQGVPDDFKDYDMQASPIAATVNGVAVVIGSGKMGIVYEMNAQTGKLIWKTPVGQHNGHDDDSPRALAGTSTLEAPYTILPGSFGGVLTNMALAGTSVYVVTSDLPTTFTSLTQVLPVSAGSLTGEVEALNLATGQIEWDTKVADLPLGAATVSNDLVFTTLYHGILIALNRDTGAIVYRQNLPTSTNAPLAIAGNTVIVPAGGPTTSSANANPLSPANTDEGNPQVVAYTAP